MNFVNVKISPLKCPGRRSGDPLSGPYGWHLQAGKNAMDVVLREARKPGQTSNRHPRAAKFLAQVDHVNKSIATGTIVKPFRPYCLQESILHNAAMDSDVWPQRVIFRQHLDEFSTTQGKNQAEFCKECGISLSYLRGVLYTPSKRLGLDILQKASAIFKRSVLNYIDDPGGDLAGQDLSNDTPENRFLARLILDGLRAKELSDEEMRWVLEDILKALKRSRVRPAAIPALRGPDSAGADAGKAASVQGQGPRRTPHAKK